MANEFVARKGIISNGLATFNVGTTLMNADGNGYAFWAQGTMNYGILMSAASNGTYGGRLSGETTSDYNMYFTMASGPNRGFVFRNTYALPFFSINPDGARGASFSTIPNASSKTLTMSGTANASSSNASIAVTNGNLYIDPCSTFGLYLNYYSGGGIFFGAAANVSAAGVYTSANAGYNIGTSTTSISGDGSSLFLKASGNTYLNTANSVYVSAIGYVYGVWFNSSRADEATAASSYIFDSGDGFFRKKTLANVKTEVVTSAAVIAGLGYTPTSSGISGSGTVGTIPKFVTNTTTIGDSRIKDNGTTISLTSTNISMGITSSAPYQPYISMGNILSGYINMNATDIQIGQSPSSIYISASASSVTIQGTCYVLGILYGYGDIVSYYSSDERLKDNKTHISNSIEKIKQIGGYEFDWNDKQTTYYGHDVGVIAQEIEKVLPELVTTRDNGYKAVKYEKIVALLIEGIKEQQIQIDKLNSKLLL